MRTALGIVAIFLVIAFALIIVLGNGIDRDRDRSLVSSSTLPVEDERTPTVTNLGQDVVLTRAEVAWVTDGDTVRVQIGDMSETVRLIGIDAPEESAAAQSDCYAEEAHAYLSRMVDNQTVYLEADTNDRDRYGRLLRYLWLPMDDGYLLINQSIVGEGFAVARIYENDDLHADLLADAELGAIAQGNGIWSACVSADGNDNPGAPEWWDGDSDLDCRDFSTRVNAQAFFAAVGGPERDPHNLDVDRNGLVCHTRPPTEPID